MGPRFSPGRMTSNSFAAFFASWAPLVLKSGRFAGAHSGEGWGLVFHFPQQLAAPLSCTFSHEGASLKSQTTVLVQLGDFSSPIMLEAGGLCPVPCPFLPAPSTLQLSPSWG